jgi:hypothetical protein
VLSWKAPANRFSHQGCFCRALRISVNVFLCINFRKKSGASAPELSVGERDDNLAGLHFNPFSILFRQRFTGAGILAQDVGRLLIEVATQGLIQVGISVCTTDCSFSG